MKKFLTFLLSASLLLLSSCGKSSDEKVKEQNTLRIACAKLPEVFDPAQTRGLDSLTILRTIYEGLLRHNEQGELSPGIAERWEISPNGLSYTFNLRKTVWNDGTPVTAHDFAYSWRRQLDRTVPAPNAHELFVLRNGEDIYQGRLTSDLLGVEALDASTLRVTLTHPEPLFLEMTTTLPFFPVSEALSKTNPEWHGQGWQPVLANGPFFPTSYDSVEKNPLYWDASVVALDGVTFYEVDETTGLLLFEQNELDWVGSPLSTLPADSLDTLKQQATFHDIPAAAALFLRVNINAEPLSNVNLRRALGLVINRQELIEHILKTNQKPLTGMIPTALREPKIYFADGATATARKLYEEAVPEGEKVHLTLLYNQLERNHKIAQVLQQQWQKELGVEISLRRMEQKSILEAMQQGEYQLALCSWFADHNDASDFLTLFENRENGTNNTGWENDAFKALLQEADLEQNAINRMALLTQAEGILIQDMPVIPIANYTFLYLKNPDIKDVYFSPTGFLDFKHAKKQL